MLEMTTRCRCRLCHFYTVYADEFCEPCYLYLTRKSSVCLTCLKDRTKETFYWYCSGCRRDAMGLYMTGNGPIYEKIGVGLYQVYGWTVRAPLKDRRMWWRPTFDEEARFVPIMVPAHVVKTGVSLTDAATFILTRALQRMEDGEMDDGELDPNDYARIYGLLERGSGDAHSLIARWPVIRASTEEYQRLVGAPAPKSECVQILTKFEWAAGTMVETRTFSDKHSETRSIPMKPVQVAPIQATSSQTTTGRAQKQTRSNPIPHKAPNPTPVETGLTYVPDEALNSLLTFERELDEKQHEIQLAYALDLSRKVTRSEPPRYDPVWINKQMYYVTLKGR